jgi:hypothetical protein
LAKSFVEFPTQSKAISVPSCIFLALKFFKILILLGYFLFFSKRFVVICKPALVFEVKALCLVNLLPLVLAAFAEWHGLSEKRQCLAVSFNR